jgi:hypothetical protein
LVRPGTRLVRHCDISATAIVSTPHSSTRPLRQLAALQKALPPESVSGRGSPRVRARRAP